MLPNDIERLPPMTSKQSYEEFMRITPCIACKGQRLKPTSLAVTVSDKNIYEITSMSIIELSEFLKNMQLRERQLSIGSQVLKEIKSRIQFLIDVGLDYLSLFKRNSNAFGWRGSTNKTGNTDWFRIGWRRLYFGRTKHRTSSKG